MTDNRSVIRTRVSESASETTQSLPERTAPNDDPFSYFKALVEGKVVPGEYDPSSLANNMIVMEILDAARRSARQGMTIRL
jgi:hypothetical protein